MPVFLPVKEVKGLEPIPKPLSTAIGCKARRSVLSAKRDLDVLQHASEPLPLREFFRCPPLSLSTSFSLDLATKQVSGWVLTILLLAASSQQAFAKTASTESATEAVPYTIVVTGGELLSGAYPDGHTYFLTRTLGPLGLRCVGSLCVDDNQTDLIAALRYATDRARLVIVTGGLGPTDNDITRETLAAFTGIAIQEHPGVLQQLAQRFGKPPAQLRSNLRKQTQVPVQGTYLKNQNGTAVGLVFEMAKTAIVALPGPPRELQAMVHGELLPYLKKRFGTRPPGPSLTLRFVGLGQSQIDQTLEDHIALDEDISISSQFQGGRVDFTFSLSHDTAEERTRLRELKLKVLKHLGEYVYATGTMTLEERVIQLLRAKGSTLALAEVGSGGSLSAALSGVLDANQVLTGSFAAPSDERLRGLLGVSDAQWQACTSHKQKAGRLAVAVAHITNSNWAISIGEPLQNEKENHTVAVAIKHPGGQWESMQIQVRGSGQWVRARLVTDILDQLRRKLN